MNNAHQKSYPQNNTALTSAPQYGGLTKRERFAMAAMQGLVSNNEIIDGTEHEWISSESVKLADALLNELED